MPKSKKQTVIGLQLSEELLYLMDKAMALGNYETRSAFARDAILEKASKELKTPIDKSIAKAPSRIGVGGKPSHKNTIPKEKRLA